MTPTGQPAALELTGSQADDGPHLPEPIADADTDYVIADEACDSADNRAATAAAGAGAAIRPRRNRKERIDCDRPVCKERQVAEGCFGKLKRCRRIATRYDKKAADFLGFAWLASIKIMLAWVVLQ